MLIVLTAEIAAGVWAYQNSDKLEAFVKSNFKHTINNEYKVIESRTQFVDTIQVHLQCCGVDGPSDWSHSKYNGAKSGSIIDYAISTSKLAYAVPPSCKEFFMLWVKVFLLIFFSLLTKNKVARMELRSHYAKHREKAR